MNELIVQLKILARAEVTLFKADAQRRTNQAMLAAISIGCVFVGLVFVNLGLFFVLTDAELDSRAAFILAGGNFGLALIPFLLRRNAKASPEEQMVREIREMAAEQVSQEFTAIADEVAAVGSGIRQVRSGLASLHAGATGSLASLLPLLIDLLKKDRP